MTPLLSLKNLKMFFPIESGIFRRKTGHVYAVNDVSLDVMEGETLGIVGESGCGKSTLARTIIRLLKPSGGTIQFQNQAIEDLNQKSLLPVRPHMQMIFQDPFESLNSRHTVKQILEEPLIIHTKLNLAERNARVLELLSTVGLPQDSLTRYPHEFSGGQRQRIGIARALALNPKLLICDEPVSALDVSIQSQILNLLVSLQKKNNLTMLFISHNLSVVHYIADRIAVMYLGTIVELGKSEDLFLSPKHPYTQALLSAVPVPEPKKSGRRRMILHGDLPSPSNPPPGCPFSTRCMYVQEKCRKEKPLLTEERHGVACHFPLS